MSMLPLTCLEIQSNLFLRKKCPCLKFFWSIFSAFGLNKEKYRIQSECKKIRTKKTPNTNSFYAAFKWVKISLCNTLTTNTPNHIETSQLICIANQLTWFYMMGYINVVNGLSYLCKVILNTLTIYFSLAWPKIRCGKNCHLKLLKYVAEN